MAFKPIQDLLARAGWIIQVGLLVNAAGQPCELELLA